MNSPLHTAVDLNSYEAVEEILDSGANPTVWNANGLTAMHECVKNRNKDILQVNYFYVAALMF